MVYAAGGHSTGMRDRSLEEFVDGDDEPDDPDEPDGSDATSDTGGDAGSAAESNEGAGTDGRKDGDATDDSDGTGVEAAVSTFEWAPGADCPRCGAAAERRWRDDDELVCADCKGW